MNPFELLRGQDVADAIARRQGAARFIAGGTNLVDLMKAGVMQPPRLVDIQRLPLDTIHERPDGMLQLGALARNADTAHHPLVMRRAPLLRAAILAGASPQIRHMATNGGNLLQRTRCVYFYDTGVPCNKRTPGSGCPAIGGIARQHAILGASEHCIATHPSDLCVALAALAAVVHVVSPRGPREIAFADFHRLPGDRPDVDTVLEPDELILHIDIPPGPWAPHSSYVKIRERASYAFAVVSVAAALDLEDDGRIRGARVALGGVAHKPWRDEGAEALLIGQPAQAAAFEAAAAYLLKDAQGQAGPQGNAHKIVLARRAVVRALEMARDGVLTNTGLDACGDGTTP